MATHQNKAQKDTIARVMHEAKHGALKSGTGKRVKNPQQAIAIALHEAGASRDQSPVEKQHALAQTKRREQASQTGNDASGGKSRAALYAEARKRDIPGRSRMNRQQLERALNA